MGPADSGTIEKEVKASLVEGFLPCAVALGIARRLNVDGREVGAAADSLGIRVINCQLGCFRFEKAQHEELPGKTISPEVIARVREMESDGRLPCPVAFTISRELKVKPVEVGDAATRLKIKLTGCQLNCFSGE
jgi:hypothetical protein